MKPLPLIAAGMCEGLDPRGLMGGASHEGKMAQKGQLTSQVRRDSLEINCPVAQSSKNKVGYTDFQKHLPRSLKMETLHSSEVCLEPCRNGVGFPGTQARR